MDGDDSSSRKGERKENRNVINTVINTSTTIRLIKTFSVAPDKMPMGGEAAVIYKACASTEDIIADLGHRAKAEVKKEVNDAFNESLYI